MNRDRWMNIQAARLAWETGREATGEGPIEAFFEIAARCNLRCTMCAINYDSRYRNSSGRPAIFAPELFERLASTFPTLVRAYLFGLGEPLLNPHLTEYIRRLASTGVEVWFNTNATLIDDDMADRIAVAGAERITVSIDGASRETYESIRRGASFDAVTRGIRALVAAGERHGRPRVNLSFVAMRSNIGELPLLADLCADLGATGIHVEPLYGQQEAALEDHYRRENLGTVDAARVDSILEETRRRARARGIDVASRFLAERGSFDYIDRVSRQEVPWTCTEPWSSIWVTAAGEVRTCCINETSFGSLFDEPFDAIWNGPAFRDFRRQHATGCSEPSGCGNCIRNGRPRHSPFFKTVEAVTYRPLEFEMPNGDSPGRIDWPAAGETVTDPLVVKGTCFDPTRPVRWELMLDREPVAVVDGKVMTESGSFVIHGPVPFLSEGAHVLWLREQNGPSARGWGHREIFFWRGDVEVPAIAATTLAAVTLAGKGRAGVFIGGRPWSDSTLERRRNAPSLLLVDTTRLAAGRHSVEVRYRWSRREWFTIERLAVPCLPLLEPESRAEPTESARLDGAVLSSPRALVPPRDCAPGLREFARPSSPPDPGTASGRR